VRKFVVRSFHVVLLLLVVSPIIVISASETQNQTGSVVSLLQQLYGNVSALPAEAFENVRLGDVEKNAVSNKINAVINQVEAGAYRGAVNKLRNDVEKVVVKWIVSPWEDDLVDLIEYIIECIEECCPPVDLSPPVIHEVVRYPDSPEYDDYVLVLACVTDCGSGVANVTLSYSVDLGESINLTMLEIDGLYEAEIPPQPYNMTVAFLVYAWDNAGNVAVSGVDSYVVSDFHDPVISYIERVPGSPDYNESVSVFVNVTEPSFASGVKEVILTYNNGTDWMNVTMSFEDGLYVATIPELPYGTVVQYTVYAFDVAGNWAVMDVYSYTVGDRFMPVARIDAPACGSYLAGYVDVEVYVYDDNFYEAQLTANETVLASWSESGLHAYVWNTTAMSDGVYLLRLEAFDEAGNIGETERQVKVDNTPPTIGIPSQSPDYMAVEPYQNVNVTVEVTDGGVGVREVVLSYSRDEGKTWADLMMDNVFGDTYMGVIPGFEAGTHVQYGIVAYDNLDNSAVENNAGEYYVYNVIPEFQGLMILIFMIAILFAAVLAKKRKILA